MFFSKQTPPYNSKNKNSAGAKLLAATLAALRSIEKMLEHF